MSDLYSNIPTELKIIPNWLLWKLENRKGKQTKVPYQPNGNNASVNDSGTWCDFETALNAMKRGGFNGIGFVVTGDMGYIFIDWDKCREPVTGEFKPGILEEIRSTQSYSEISQSETGAHSICRGVKPGEACKKNDREMYTSGRFFVMTGNHISGTPTTIQEAPKEAIQTIYNNMVGNTPAPVDNNKTKQRSPDLTDEQIVSLLMGSRLADTFEALWDGIKTEYANDASVADYHLCRLIAFYTQTPAQIERIARRSNLVRDKWDRVDYVERTISEAIDSLNSVYTGNVDTDHEPVMEELSREEILQKGAKCIDLKLTINVPDGHLINRFAKYVKRRTDAYQDYSYCAAMWLISACTQGKAVLELAQEDIKPNLWFMLHGLSSVSRKSTVLGMAKRKYETCTGDYVANHEYSIQGYYEDLEEHRVSNFIRDEAAGQLHNMHKKHNDGMAQVECLVYDGQSITKKLASKKGKKDEVHVRNPYVTKLDATTPDNYFSAINTDDLHSGFVARYLYCHPKYQRPRMPMRMADKDTSDDTELIIAISSIWDHFSRCDVVSFTVEDAAMDYYNQCVEQMEDRIMETGDNLLSMGWARNQVHILKIAMLIEIGKERISTHISLQTMQEAVRVVTEYFLPMFMETASRIQHTDLYNKIEKVRDVLLKNNGTVNRSTLLRYSRLLKDDFDRVIQTMLESGEIEGFQEKGNKQRWYVLKAETSHISTISHNSHVHMGIKKSCEKREFNISNHDCENNNSTDNDSDKKEETKDNSSPYTCGYVLKSTCEAVETVKPVKLCEIEGDPQFNKIIEDSLDLWEKTACPIFAKNAHKAKLDIVKYHKMYGINPQLIHDAVDRRAAGRCVDCGSDTTNNVSQDGRRCKPCHDIYSNPPPVVIPEEFNLEDPVEVVQ